MRRNNTGNHFDYGRLEKRSLLAGMVYVDVSGQDLFVIGDNQDNVFSVDLKAQNTAQLVQGQDQTAVRFSSAFDSGFDFSQLRDVQIYTNTGDDCVTIYADGFSAKDDLIVSLAHGDDTLYVEGGHFNGDVRVYSGANHDSVAFSDFSVGDDLGIYGLAGTDAISLNAVNVGDQAELLGQFGHDTVLVNNSFFGGDAVIEMGEGADRFETLDSTYRDRVQTIGRQGWDSVLLNDSNQFDSNPLVHTIEREATAVNEFGRAGEAIAQLKSDFFAYGGEIHAVTGNAVQNSLSDLATAFSVPLFPLEFDSASQTVSIDDPTPTVSVVWDKAVQSAVEATAPGPTIASRAYAMLHTAMYDAWSAYDALAISTTMADSLQRPAAENTNANKTQAMSFAAYRVLDDLFSNQTALFDSVMAELGYNPANMSTDVTSPVGIGNSMAAELLSVRHNDGSNQLGTDANGTAGVAYSDTSDYVHENPTGNPTILDLWTAEYVPVDATPGTQDRIQEFLTPHWGSVDSFSMTSSSQFLPPAPEPFLLVDGTLNVGTNTITLADGSNVSVDKSLIGTVINPAFISQAEEVVEISANLTDEQKLIAEFWEDGGGTSFPPGTFMTFGNLISARDNHSVDDDAKLYLALSNAVFDAGVATWEAKAVYDYVRPVRAIRSLGELGLIGEFNSDLGGYAIDAWTPTGGTQTILATEFLTYQTPGGDVSPPFAEYTSGHSAFSAAGATVLELFTGSDEFGGSVTFEPGVSRFEAGVVPSSAVTLTWDTFSGAADEAGFSRLYGGIHFTDGDVNGRVLGDEVGEAVWEQAQFFINGGV